MLLEPLRRQCVNCLMPVALLLAPLTLLPALGEETNRTGFHKTVRQISEARSRIDSYDVTITGKVSNIPKRVRLSDGSEYEIEKVPVSFTLRMAFDKVQGKLLVARQDSYRLRSTGEKETAKWRIFGRRLKEIEDSEKWTSEKGQFIGAWTPFFDPLALGVCFDAEFHRGDPWERIVANYLEWSDDFKVQNLADGKVRYQNHQFSIVIDTRRGQWPVEMIRSRGDNIQQKTELKIANVHGHWLPEAATVTLPKEATTLHFEWHSVNQPIPEARFMREDIESRFGLSSLGD